MDQQTPAQEMPASAPAPSIKPTKKNKGILFGIIFLIIFIVILLGVIANRLGWLPQNEVPTGTSQQSKPDVNETNAPQSQELNPEVAIKTLSDFIPPLITSSLAPSISSDITLVTGGFSNQNDFIAAWQAKAGKVDVKYSISSEGSSEEKISSIHINLDSTQLDIISENLAEELTSQYFLSIPKSNFVCTSPDNNLNYCESFWQEEDGTKRGVGIKGNRNTSSESGAISVFFCQFTKESKNYSWKSCAEEFAETGVQ